MIVNDRQRELVDLVDYAGLGFAHYKKNFQELEDIYTSVMNKETEEYLKKTDKSRLFFNKAQSKARRVSDQINKAYFTNDKFVSIATDGEDKDNIALKTEEAVKKYTEEANLFTSLQQGIYKLPFIGTMVSRTYWNNGLVVEHVDIENLWFDPDALTQNDVRYVVHTIYLAIEDIEALQKSKVFKKDVNIRELVATKDAKGYTRVELKEIYTKIDGSWFVSTVYDRTHFLRTDESLKDGLPFNWGGCIPQIKKIDEPLYIANYYEPILTSIKTLQEEYNTRRNQIIDGIRQQLNPKKIMPKQAGVSQIDLESPTGVIYSSTPSAIQVVPAADIRGAMNDMSIIDHEMSELSGVSPMMSGVSNDKTKTATEKGIEHSEGSLKLEIFIRNLNETFFEPLLRRIVTLVYTYADAKYFVGIDRAKQMPKFKFTFEVGLGVTNDVVKIQQGSQVMGGLSQLFQMAMAIQNKKEAMLIYGATKKLQRELMPLMGIKNVDEYLPEETELGTSNTNRSQGIFEQQGMAINEGMVGSEQQHMHQGSDVQQAPIGSNEFTR
ncbi:MAG: hypothetical protein EOM41_06705 [Bacilli bacterium]|nr:hypothetical protein [Bacilli bacterium]